MPINTQRETKETPKKTQLYIADYTDKSFVVTGDTIDHSKALLELKGTFNPKTKLGPGYIFSKARKESVETYINTGTITPFVFDRSKFNGFLSKSSKDKSSEKILEPVFKDLSLAFEAELEYTGDSILDTIQKIKDKYIVPPVVPKVSKKEKPKFSKKVETEEEYYSEEFSD